MLNACVCARGCVDAQVDVDVDVEETFVAVVVVCVWREGRGVSRNVAVLVSLRDKDVSLNERVHRLVLGRHLDLDRFDE